MDISFEDSLILMSNLISHEQQELDTIWNSWEYFFNHHPEERDDHDSNSCQ